MCCLYIVPFVDIHFPQTYVRNMGPHFKADAILSGMETRTSSPVRIMRDTNGESRVHGIYPGGEGAGYAGGIMSAAMDGLRLADDVMKRYHPVY